MEEEKRNYCSNKSLEFMIKWAIFDRIQRNDQLSIPDYSNLMTGSNTGECFERTKIPENITPGWLSGRRSYIETKMNLHDSVRYREFRMNISEHGGDRQAYCNLKYLEFATRLKLYHDIKDYNSPFNADPTQTLMHELASTGCTTLDNKPLMTVLVESMDSRTSKKFYDFCKIDSDFHRDDEIFRDRIKRIKKFFGVRDQ